MLAPGPVKLSPVLKLTETGAPAVPATSKVPTPEPPKNENVAGEELRAPAELSVTVPPPAGARMLPKARVFFGVTVIAPKIVAVAVPVPVAASAGWEARPTATETAAKASERLRIFVSILVSPLSLSRPSMSMVDRDSQREYTVGVNTF